MQSDVQREENYISNGMIVVIVLLLLILMLEAYLIFAPRNPLPEQSNSPIPVEQTKQDSSIVSEIGG